VNGDVTMVRRLVMILLNNAVKYTTERGHIRRVTQQHCATVQLVLRTRASRQNAWRKSSIVSIGRILQEIVTTEEAG